MPGCSKWYLGLSWDCSHYSQLWFDNNKRYFSCSSFRWNGKTNVASSSKVSGVAVDSCRWKKLLVSFNAPLSSARAWVLGRSDPASCWSLAERVSSINSKQNIIHCVCFWFKLRLLCFSQIHESGYLLIAIYMIEVGNRLFWLGSVFLELSLRKNILFLLAIRWFVFCRFFLRFRVH